MDTTEDFIRGFWEEEEQLLGDQKGSIDFTESMTFKSPPTYRASWTRARKPGQEETAPIEQSYTQGEVSAKGFHQLGREFARHVRASITGEMKRRS